MVLRAEISGWGVALEGNIVVVIVWECADGGRAKPDAVLRDSLIGVVGIELFSGVEIGRDIVNLLARCLQCAQKRMLVGVSGWSQMHPVITALKYVPLV